MRGYTERYQWMRVLLLLGLVFAFGCSAQRQDPHSDMVADGSDPFTDPFFTQPSGWDDSVLRQSEVLARGDEGPKKPQSLLERSEGVIFSTFLVGASLAKLALPFLGF
jgi:hypothetical protein